MKDVSNGKIMIQPVALRPKTYSYLTDASDENKKAERIKTCNKTNS